MTEKSSSFVRRCSAHSAEGWVHCGNYTPAADPFSPTSALHAFLQPVLNCKPAEDAWYSMHPWRVRLLETLHFDFLNMGRFALTLRFAVSVSVGEEIGEVA